MVRLGNEEGTSHLFEVGTDKGRIEVLANLLKVDPHDYTQGGSERKSGRTRHGLYPQRTANRRKSGL